MKKKIIAAALAAAVLLAAGGLLFGLHRIGETTISAGPEPAAPEEVQPAEPEEPSVPEQPEKEPEEAEPVQTQTPVPEAVQTEKPCIVIDAGHQLNADYGKEPVGPGSTELKTRVSAGTTGVSTGIPEYELNLAVSLLLQQELTARGYTVVMTRTENDVSISNAERAQIANTQQAGAFIRVHANASESAAASGIMAICMTLSNPYNGALYEKSRALSDCVLERLGAALDKPQNERTLWQTDTMTGINYSEVPVTIVEMGFMTNPAEDEAMATDAYRAKIAAGIADGVDAYFRRLQRQSLTEDAALAEALREQLQGSSDKWDIWAERLQEGTYAHVQENIDPDAPQMVSASLIKLFIMGAVYDAERSGTLTPGAQEDAICQMISVSDNAAANELTCLLGGGSEADGRAAVERAIDHGYFGADAYIDNRTGTLVVRGAAPQPPRPAEPAPAPAPEDQYAALQRQLRQANDAIPDPVMTAKISRLEEVSARIFALAKKDPDKKAQLQKFMDYYLPTALKLLNTYAQLSAQDVQGTNITEAKQSIERSMDLLITAFENQLDKLFASDALDVSTDIAALEGMLNLDGLTGGDFAPRS